MMSKNVGGTRTALLDRRRFVKTIAAGLATAAVWPSRLDSSVYDELNALEQKYLTADGPDGKYWEYVANQFMFEPGLIMMNNGTAGAMPRVVYSAVANYFRIQAENPYRCYSTFDAFREEARHLAAQFIGADPEEVTLLRNTTEGLAIVAYGLDLKPGDEVLMSNVEHPAGIWPWRLQAKKTGIKIKEAVLPLPPKNKDDVLNAFSDAITPRTRVILISHAVYITGLIPPLKELCQLARDKNILVCADGAHCVGMLNLNMHDLGVDFYANSGYKWLGAPTGTGIFYVKKDLQKDLLPNIVELDWEKATDALKYSHIGRSSDPLYIALGEAVRFQNQIRKDRIERRIKSLGGYLREEGAKIPGVQLFTPLDPYLSGGLTVFGLEGIKNDQLVNYVLEKHNMVIAASYREKNAVRICTHMWITREQIDLLLEAIKDLLRKE